MKDTLGRNNRRLKDKTCPHCGEIFRPSRAISKYCSNPCRWANNGGHNRKEEMWRKPDKKGYITGTVWIDDETQIKVRQHRWIMERHIGRKLLPDEDVHHKNGIKHDNRIENLEIIDHAEHARQHNYKRVYKKGYKINVTPEDMKRRIDQCTRMREIKASRKCQD